MDLSLFGEMNALGVALTIVCVLAAASIVALVPAFIMDLISNIHTNKSVEKVIELTSRKTLLTIRYGAGSELLQQLVKDEYLTQQDAAEYEARLYDDIVASDPLETRSPLRNRHHVTLPPRSMEIDDSRGVMK